MLIFMIFCNKQTSKTRVLKADGLGCDEVLKALPYSWREGRQATLGQIAQSEHHLKCMEEAIDSSQSTSLRGGIHRDASSGTEE